MKVTFYYVRHGETLFNEVRRMQGKCDSPLTDCGREQAEDTASALRQVHFDRAFCSSSERAWDTAEILCKYHGLKPVLMKELKEFDFGSLDGEMLDTMKDRIQPHRMADDWTDVGGENVPLFRERAEKGFSEILSSCKDGDTVLIVSHGSFFMHLMKTLLEYDQQEYITRMHSQNKPFVPNAGIAIFTYEDGKYHLEKEPMTADEYRSMNAKTMELYYVRHGETVFNTERRLQGWSDSPLTENGIAQVQGTADKLKDVDFGQCWCSSTERTRDTAKIILGDRNIPVVYTKNLREVFYGQYEGKHFSAGDNEFTRMHLDEDWSDVRGEVRADIEKRLKTVLNNIYDSCRDGEKILVVSHGDLYMCLLEYLFHITHRQLYEKNGNPIPNAGYAVLRYCNGNYELVKGMRDECE